MSKTGAAGTVGTKQAPTERLDMDFIKQFSREEIEAEIRRQERENPIRIGGPQEELTEEEEMMRQLKLNPRLFEKPQITTELLNQAQPQSQVRQIVSQFEKPKSTEASLQSKVQPPQQKQQQHQPLAQQQQHSLAQQQQHSLAQQQQQPLAQQQQQQQLTLAPAELSDEDYDGGEELEEEDDDEAVQWDESDYEEYMRAKAAAEVAHEKAVAAAHAAQAKALAKARAQEVAQAKTKAQAQAAQVAVAEAKAKSEAAAKAKAQAEAKAKALSEADAKAKAQAAQVQAAQAQAAQAQAAKAQAAQAQAARAQVAQAQIHTRSALTSAPASVPTKKPIVVTQSQPAQRVIAPAQTKAVPSHIQQTNHITQTARPTSSSPTEYIPIEGIDPIYNAQQGRAVEQVIFQARPTQVQPQQSLRTQTQVYRSPSIQSLPVTTIQQPAMVNQQLRKSQILSPSKLDFTGLTEAQIEQKLRLDYPEPENLPLRTNTTRPTPLAQPLPLKPVNTRGINPNSAFDRFFATEATPTIRQTIAAPQLKRVQTQPSPVVLTQQQQTQIRKTPITQQTLRAVKQPSPHIYTAPQQPTVVRALQQPSPYRAAAAATTQLDANTYQPYSEPTTAYDPTVAQTNAARDVGQQNYATYDPIAQPTETATQAADPYAAPQTLPNEQSTFNNNDQYGGQQPYGGFGQGQDFSANNYGIGGNYGNDGNGIQNGQGFNGFEGEGQGQGFGNVQNVNDYGNNNFSGNGGGLGNNYGYDGGFGGGLNQGFGGGGQGFGGGGQGFGGYGGFGQNQGFGQGQGMGLGGYGGFGGGNTGFGGGNNGFGGGNNGFGGGNGGFGGGNGGFGGGNGGFGGGYGGF